MRAAQAAGLAVLGAGLVALLLASPLASLGALVVGAVLAGAGHGLVVLGAQDELNGFVPPERRGEVTAAFIGCIYAPVAGAVIATGLLDEWSRSPRPSARSARRSRPSPWRRRSGSAPGRAIW